MSGDALDRYLEWQRKHGFNPPCFSGVGTGWLSLLDRLVADLEAMGWDRDLQQVKEKFGGLRFSVGAGTLAMFERIDQAEAESFTVCEECGRPGKPRGGGWIKTLCEDCEAKR